MISFHAGLLASAAEAGSAQTQAGWVTAILTELGRTQAAGFLLDVVKWTLLGALCGVLIAVCACALFSRLQWYDLRWRFGGAVRWTLFSATILISAVLFGLAGFWSGAISGSERVVTRSRLATDVFPAIADVLADGMAWVQLHASGQDTDDARRKQLLEEFRAGKWELRAAQFIEQLETVTEEMVTNLVARLEQSALENTPGLKGTFGEKLLRQFVSGIGRSFIKDRVSGEMKSFGADRVYAAIRDGLAKEASKAGDPQTISHREISTFLVRDGITPAILAPIRSTARSQQIPLVLIALVLIVAPPACIGFARGRFGRRPGNESTAPAMPAEEARQDRQ